MNEKLLIGGVVVCILWFVWSLVRINRKKQPPPMIDVGKTTAYLQMKDGTIQLLNREGQAYSYYYVHSDHRIERALDNNWVQVEGGIIFNRDQIISYRTRTIEHLVPGID